MAKACELCDQPARIYCESDRANLCWGCDARVHGANFLVARHSRRLLCRYCQAPTPWRASGPRLGPTASVCELCFGGARVGRSGGVREVAEEEEMEEGGGPELGREGEDDDDEEDEDDDDDDDVDEEGEDGEDEEDGGNQVVPLSMEAKPTPSVTPPPVASSSSSEESPSAFEAFPRRTRQNAALSSSDRSPPQPSYRHLSPPPPPAAAHSSERTPEKPEDRKAATRHPPTRASRLTESTGSRSPATWRLPSR